MCGWLAGRLLVCVFARVMDWLAVCVVGGLVVRLCCCVFVVAYLAARVCVWLLVGWVCVCVCVFVCPLLVVALSVCRLIDCSVG